MKKIIAYVLIAAGWISLIGMAWVFFMDIQPLSLKNIIIFLLIFLFTLFATAVIDAKPKPNDISQIRIVSRNRPD